MENEQEGIVLETINPEQDSIVIPDIPGEETDNNTVTETPENEGNDTTRQDDEDRESLKRGLNKERALRKAAEKKNKEFEARLEALEKASKGEEKTTLDTLIESGVDESIAKSIAKAIDSKQTDTNKFEKEIADLKFDNSLKALSKEEGYEDIEDYADEIKDLVDKGLTIEQSYHAVSYNKPQSKNTKSEITRKIEAKMQNNNARKEILEGINNNSGAANNSTKVNLSATEKALAAAAGMTAQEYAAYKGMNSNRDYTEYKSRKK